MKKIIIFFLVVLVSGCLDTKKKMKPETPVAEMEVFYVLDGKPVTLDRVVQLDLNDIYQFGIFENKDTIKNYTSGNYDMIMIIITNEAKERK